MASLLTVVRLLGALVGVALLTTRGLSGFYAEAGLIPLDDPRFSRPRAWPAGRLLPADLPRHRRRLLRDAAAGAASWAAQAQVR